MLKMLVVTTRIGEVKVRIDKFQVHLEKQFIGLCTSWDEWGKREGWIKYHTQNPDLLGGLMLESCTDIWNWGNYKFRVRNVAFGIWRMWRGL